ncbi:hypothetical protein PIB30_080543 [Stylosanthes scabra]|uniref:Uncharacterized protein n=1 Tax=Stylosanthes scabra TaxID=79078 RepID=A0ABU6VTE2_9FABA|nr:hypothetical protein [Stylosanthes scabra]
MVHNENDEEEEEGDDDDDWLYELLDELAESDDSDDEEVEEEPEKEVDDEVVEEETKGETFFIATIFHGNEVKEIEIPVKYEDLGKATEVFHVTRLPAPRKKGAHQLQVGSKEIEPDKLLRSAKRKEYEYQKANGFKGKGLRIAPPQLKKKKKKVPLNLERKKEKKKKKQEEDEPEKKMVLQCSSFDKFFGKLKIFKKILHHHKSMDAHLVKDNSKWK